MPKPSALPALSSIAAFLIDLDGTLVDTEELHWQTAVAVLVGLGLDASDPALDPGPGWAELPFWEGVIERFGLGVTAEDLVARRSAELGRRLLEQPAPVRPGARELLVLLAERDRPRLVVSSSPTSQIADLLASAGLAALVPGWVSGHDDTARSKPHPDPYLLGMRRLSIDPAEAGRVVAIEDSATGVAAACAAGTYVVGVPSPGVRRDDLRAADLCLDDLRQLVELLDRHGPGERA